MAMRVRQAQARGSVSSTLRLTPDSGSFPAECLVFEPRESQKLYAQHDLVLCDRRWLCHRRSNKAICKELAHNCANSNKHKETNVETIKRSHLIGAMVLALSLVLAACGGTASPTGGTATSAPAAGGAATTVDPAAALKALETKVYSTGPNGETPTSASEVKLS